MMYFSSCFLAVFQLEKDSQHAVNPKAGELRASQSSLLNGISSFLSDAVWLVATTWSSSDSTLGVTGIHTAGTTRILHKRKKLFAVPCYDGEKTLASANEDILNLHQESETPPDPGEEDGLNQRLESEMQQDPEPRQKDDLNWKQESATQRDPELEETDLPKGITSYLESERLRPEGTTRRNTNTIKSPTPPNTCTLLFPSHLYLI
ncbi:uncharacterized protein LOC135979973 [Chrysemys picta bellii]|uniref:uncharacterized protein LOC135979973 n=1 Tax=Chrysemys picta bellii TaxID=8478 RepID=UPI0032B1F896